MAVKAKKTTGVTEEEIKWPYGKKNYLILSVALVVIIIGYITLGQGSITLAPILLVLGYCVLIPIALISKAVPKANTTTHPTNPPRAEQSTVEQFHSAGHEETCCLRGTHVHTHCF
jgi:xanthine/uracil permease